MTTGEDPDPPSTPGPTLAQLGERGLIARLRGRLPPPGPDVLLGTAAPDRAPLLARRVTEQVGTPVHRIGEVQPAVDGVRFFDRSGRPQAVAPGFDHFA